MKRKPTSKVRSRRARHSKGKGSKFERDICKRLSLWVTDGKRDDVFWRSAMSGGRATVRFKKGQRTQSQCGDICAVSSEGELLLSTFLISCKHVKDLGIKSALLSGKGILAKYWKEVCKEAKRHNLWELLIAKENNSPVVVLLYSGVFIDRFARDSRFNPTLAGKLNKLGPVVIISLDDLLSYPYDPKAFR